MCVNILWSFSCKRYLRLIKHHAMKMYILNLGARWRWVVSSILQSLHIWGRVPSTHWKQAGLNVEEMKKKLPSTTENWTLLIQSVAQLLKCLSYPILLFILPYYFHNREYFWRWMYYYACCLSLSSHINCCYNIWPLLNLQHKVFWH